MAFQRGKQGIVEVDPVREFTGDPRRLAVSLLEALQRQRAQLVETIATRDAENFEEYRFWRGQIDGIDIAINFCKEHQKKAEA